MTVKYETFFEIPDELADELILFVANNYDGFPVFLEALDFIYPNIDTDVVLALWKECKSEAKCREKEKLLEPYEVFKLTFSHYITDKNGNTLYKDEPIISQFYTPNLIPQVKNQVLKRLYFEIEKWFYNEQEEQSCVINWKKK